MFDPKNILLIQNFDFEDGVSPPKDKFLIVLLQIDEDAIVAPLTSSQDFVPDSYNKEKRCIKDDPSCIHCYFIPKDLIIGLGGFAFRKDTYVYINTSTMKKRSLSALINKYNNSVRLNDTLTDNEYCDFLYCIYKSQFVARGVKKAMEPIIASIEEKRTAI